MGDELRVGRVPLRRDCRGRGRQDVVRQLLDHNLEHLVQHAIFNCLEGLELLAATKVSPVWSHVAQRTIQRRLRALKTGRESRFASKSTWLWASEELRSTAVVALCSDNDKNLYVLSVVNGRPQVTIGSLFNGMKDAWTQRLSEFRSQQMSNWPSLSSAALRAASFSGAASNVVLVVSLGAEVRIYACNFPFKWLQVVHSLQPHGSDRVIHDVVMDVADVLTLATASDDMSVNLTLFDLDKRCVLAQRRLLGHVNRVRVLDMDGNRIVSGSDDRSVKVWCADNSRSLHTLRGLNMPVEHVAIHGDSVVAAARNAVIVFNVNELSSSLLCRISSDVVALHLGPSSCLVLDDRNRMHVINEEHNANYEDPNEEAINSSLLSKQVQLDSMPGQMMALVIEPKQIGNNQDQNSKQDCSAQIKLYTFDLT